MAVLGLRLLRLFSSCGARASHCGGFSCCGTWALGPAGLSTCGSRLQSAGPVLVARGLSCSGACGICPDQGWTCVFCIGRRILYHWATREALHVSSSCFHISLKLFSSIFHSGNNFSILFITDFLFTHPLSLWFNSVYFFFFPVLLRCNWHAT